MIKSKKNLFFIFLTLIIFLIINNFFYNFYYTFKSKYHDRMTYHYGFCNKSGYGFVNYIYEKYQIEENLRIINYEEHPNSEWFFYNTTKNILPNKLIILNFNSLADQDSKTNKIKIEGKYYKIIDNKENCFYLENL